MALEKGVCSKVLLWKEKTGFELNFDSAPRGICLRIAGTTTGKVTTHSTFTSRGRHTWEKKDRVGSAKTFSISEHNKGRK